MANPFEKRATEYIRDDSAFLSYITPEPIYTFLEQHAKDGTLYEKLCMIVGTPGSGKTVLSTLLQFKTVRTLLNSHNLEGYKVIYQALSKCNVISDHKLVILGCRLPLESEYREFWELPYNEDVKFGLFRSFLQARGIISWIRNLESTYEHKNIRIIYKEGSEAASETVGGKYAKEVLDKARKIERLIYDIGSSLIPPDLASLSDEVTSPYHPFDIIERFSIREADNTYTELKPLIMLDDAHTLHPSQLLLLRNWLASREMRISRWLLMRLDSQTPEEVIDSFYTSSDETTKAGLSINREITNISLQGNDNRRRQREAFRKMARNMADRYLRQMPTFNRQGFTSLSDILNTQIKEISPSKRAGLVKAIDAFQNKMHISITRRAEMEEEINSFLSNSEAVDKGDDLRLAMLRIMMHRYINRVPQKSLFSAESTDYGPEPSKPLKATSGLADGARIFLMHEYDRPYYYGIDALCDGSSENAELFLRLTAVLVEAAEARLVRSSNATLAPSYQHKLISNRASDIISEWEFPSHREVGKLCSHIARQCQIKSLMPNAPLDGGANAFGILQEEFVAIPKKYPKLATVIKFAVAYNAITLKPKYNVKNKVWCLIELSGPLLIKYGLTMKRGGFLEKSVNDLLSALKGTQDGIS